MCGWCRCSDTNRTSIKRGAKASEDNSKKQGTACQEPLTERTRYERGVRDSALTDTELRTLNAVSVPR